MATFCAIIGEFLWLHKCMKVTKTNDLGSDIRYELCKTLTSEVAKGSNNSKT